MKGKEIILGVTGSIAAYKAAEIVSRMVQEGARVTVVMTESATKLVAPLTFQTLSGRPVLTDMFNPPLSSEISHIALTEKADLVLVAPATANFIGKVSAGIADNELTSLMLAVRCPVIVAPAMNERMYDNVIVRGNIARLKKLGYLFIEPESGFLACRTVGVGRLASIETILAAVAKVLGGGARKKR